MVSRADGKFSVNRHGICYITGHTPPTTMAAKKTEKTSAKKSAVKAAAKKAPVKKAAAKKASTGKKVAVASAKPATAKPSLDAIARAAYFNYRRRVDQGLPGDAHSDWVEAERSLGVK